MPYRVGAEIELSRITDELKRQVPGLLKQVLSLWSGPSGRNYVYDMWTHFQERCVLETGVLAF